MALFFGYRHVRHVLWLMVILSGIGPVAATDLVIYTEDYPPFSYADDNGTVVGEGTKKVRQVLEAAGVTYSFRLMPWARAVLFAETQPNALIYSMTRTPSREARYDWLFPLASADFQLFKRRGDTRQITLEAVRAGSFSGACVSGDLTCDLLRHIGMPEERITVFANNPTGDFRMVAAGRADLYVSETSVSDLRRARDGFAENPTEPALRLEGKYGLYLAAGWQVKSAIRQKVRAAYEKLLSDGRYELMDLASAGP